MTHRTNAEHERLFPAYTVTDGNWQLLYTLCIQMYLHERYRPTPSRICVYR
jgi:hypothetical protein